MTEQPPISAAKTPTGRPDLNSLRPEHLLSALNRLKSDISGVEARHPGLGSELSSLCEMAIAELDSRDSRREDARQAGRDNPGVATVEPADMPELAPTDRHKSNAVVSAIDKAGSHLITGLEKTGDGIIFVLGKLFANRLPKANPSSPTEADLLNL
jgi:hypothetical protein